MNDDAHVVTRAILREELARYPTREELKETLRQELARYPTREELKEELTRYATREDLGLWMHTVAQQHEIIMGSFARLEELIATGHEALRREIAQAARVAAEEHRRELGVLDDRYRDLPDRVTALERDLDTHRRDAALHPLRPRRPRRPQR